MRETKTHTIDGNEYRIQQLGAKQGRLVLARVLRLVSTAAEAADPVAKLGAAMTDAEVEYLCDTFARTTRVVSDSREWVLADIFDEHFAGRYGALVRWLWASLETNYASFLGELGLSPETLVAAAKSGIRTSQIGPSGASSSPVSADLSK